MSEQVNIAPRPPEIENLSNRLVIHPLSNALAPFLARAGVHPNVVSAAGLAFGMAAAWLYLQPGSWPENWPSAVAALACMLGWHVMDGADGQVARLTGKASATGRAVDAIADYTVFILVYISLASVSDAQYGVWAWAAAGIAGASHILQAALYELQREKYIAWTDPEAPLPRGRTPQGEAWQKGAFWWLEWVYVRLQRLAGGGGIEIPDADIDRDARREIAARYRTHYATHVHSWGVLSANAHTLAIFLFVVMGWPLGYFLFEALVMNMALVLLSARTRRLDKEFTDTLVT